MKLAIGTGNKIFQGGALPSRRTWRYYTVPETWQIFGALTVTTLFITHYDCQLHDMGAHHPECPARLSAIEDQLIASGE